MLSSCYLSRHKLLSGRPCAALVREIARGASCVVRLPPDHAPPPYCVQVRRGPKGGLNRPSSGHLMGAEGPVHTKSGLRSISLDLVGGSRAAGHGCTVRIQLRFAKYAKSERLRILTCTKPLWH